LQEVRGGLIKEDETMKKSFEFWGNLILFSVGVCFEKGGRYLEFSIKKCREIMMKLLRKI
jgi:hypothetical protein